MLSKAKIKSKSKGDYNSSFLNICNTKKTRKVLANSIPVLSIFAFLGILSCLFNIVTYNDMVDIITGNVRIDELGNDAGNKTYAVSGNTGGSASASLVVDDNTIYDTINAQYGAVNYIKHQIKVTASEIGDYKLTITGPSTISTTDNVGNTVSDATVLTGANGNTPSTMAANSWGYAWGAENTDDISTLTYQSFTGTEQTLTGEKVTDEAVDFGRTLAFAAKFADDAKDGHYKARVTLNLTVTPTAVTIGIWNKADGTTEDSGITTMQSMTPEICANATIGDSMLLQDSRDGNVYSIAKLADEKCWMTQNLAFDITQAIDPMSTSNSDVVLDWFWPTTPTRYTTGTGWSADNTAVAYITNPTVDSNIPGDGEGYQSSYGYYYSWCAATAGCQDKDGNNPDANVDAASSICPKGWKLPAGTPGTGTNDFAKVVGLASTNIAANGNYWSNLSSPSFANKTLAVNGSTWLAAGYVDPGIGLRNPGTNGRYWSRTAYSTISGYDLNFHSGSLYPASAVNRCVGYSVRCIADKPQEYTYTITYQYGNGFTGSGLPAAQTITTTSSTQEMTISSSRPLLNSGCSAALGTWEGSDGKIYNPGDTVILTADQPNLVLTTKSTTGPSAC